MTVKYECLDSTLCLFKSKCYAHFMTWGLGLRKVMWCINKSLFFFKFFLSPHLQYMDIPGLGIENSHSNNAGCSKSGSLTHWARPGIEPESSQRQQVLNPLSHNRNSRVGLFNLKKTRTPSYSFPACNTPRVTTSPLLPLSSFISQGTEMSSMWCVLFFS